MKRTITGITDSGFTEDLSHAHVSFATSLGTPFICEFTPQVLERILTGLSEMAQNLRNQIAAKDGLLQVQAVPAKDAGAVSPIGGGGGKVMLTIRADNNDVRYQFSLTPDVAMRLSTELQEAVEFSQQQASQTRQ